ncbi:alpha/beta fold hydrolase [Nocardia veterana]|uniref:alpha/beta fold hydrolase n=1 Tax=Nocardia veterana TaxID=132249 RepID=UPI000A046D16
MTASAGAGCRTRRRGRAVTGALLVVLGPPVAIGAGVGAALGVAVVAPAPAVFLIAGLAVLTFVMFAAARAGLRLMRAHRPTVIAVGLAVTVAAVVCTASAVTILRPFPPREATATPANVRYLDLPTGSRLAYVHVPAADSAQRRDTPVVFLHGGPGTPGEGIPAGGTELAALGFDVYAYDQLGAGRSSRLADVTGYTVARQVADLDAIREVLGAERLVLIGRSWGGSLAAQYLAAHPDRVAKVVFVAPGALWAGAYRDGGVGEPWTGMKPEQQARYDRLTSSPRVLAQALLMAVAPNAAHALVPDAEADSWMHEVALSGRDGTSCSGAPSAPPHDNPQGFYVNQMTNRDFARMPDSRPALGRVRVPALVMAAQCDFVRWPVTREYRDVLPSSTLVDIQGAGHAISTDRPGLYVELLRTFLLDEDLPLPGYTAAEPPPGRWAR